MRWYSVLSVIGVVALGFMLVKNVLNKLADGVSFVGARLRWGNISTSGVNLTVILSYRNSNPISFPVESFIGSIVYGPHRLAELNLTNPTVLKANSVTEIPINTSMVFINLVDEVVNLIISGKLRQGLRAMGFIKINGISMDVNYSLISA